MESLSQTLSRMLARWRRSIDKRIHKARALINPKPEAKPVTESKWPTASAVSPDALPERSVLAPPAKVVAWYLPQFHPVPENDEWWGAGFTEWRNVVRATPIFPGHLQPQLPADLGFYDLRLPETQQRQADLARSYGIHGFAYHYYWFNGRRLLERPLEQLLQTGKPDFPFCINWANENWTRRWDGRDQEILLGQDHSLESDIHFIRDVMPILKDPRYITCDGKPMLIVYRADLLQNAPETAAAWREEAVRAGLPGLHLCAVQFVVRDPSPLGFDALVEFPPHHFRAPKLDPPSMGATKDFRGTIFHFWQGVLHAAAPARREFVFYRGAMPGWDNTARRLKSASVFHGATPEMYRYWLHQMLVESRHSAQSEDHFVFVNAWNEWAEGAHLEPDQIHGHRWLEATQQAIQAAQEDGRTCPALPHGISPVDPAVIAPAPSEVTIPWRFPASKSGQPYGSRRPVLCVSHDAARAGAQLILLRIVEHLASHPELEPWVLLRRGGPLEESFARVAPVLRIEETGGGRLAFPEALEQTVRQFRKKHPAFALCNTVVSSDVAEACHRHGIPVLSQVLELPTSISSLGRETVTKTQRYSQRVIAASAFVRSALLNAYPFAENQVEVVHYGVPPTSLALPSREQSRQRVLEEFGWPSDTFLVLGCGSIHPRKGPDLFVQTAIALGDRVTNGRIRFLWLGGNQDGPTPRLWCDHDLTIAGLISQLRFAGERSDPELFFAAADAFALTSREDPFPTVNLEAMAAGLPVVAFAGAGGACEAFGNDAGIIVPYLNPQAMASALAHLAEHPEEAKALGALAKGRIEAEFTDQHFFARFMVLAEREFGPFRQQA